LLVLGESTAAGVGAADHGQGLAGQAAAALAAGTGRPVHWRVIGRNGATARFARRELLAPAADVAADVAIIALGVNDTLRLHAPARWTADLRALVHLLRERCGALPVVLAGVPPMHRFPALPQPLRGVMGMRAAVLDRAAERLAGQLNAVRHVHVPLPPAEVDGFFCPDRFHPSPRGYAAWGAALGSAAAAMLESSAGTPS
ncbi:MAG TPA: SGNH/GDSL hydrolase family protein, partial [Longimicrobium sp.]